MRSHFLRAATKPTITYMGNVGTATASVTMPAYARVGDFALFIQSAGVFTSATAPALVVPSGWTNVVNIPAQNTLSQDAQRAAVSYKVLTSGDLGATVTGYSGQAGTRSGLVVFRPSVVNKTWSVGSVSQEGKNTGSNFTTQTVVVPSSYPVVAVALYGGFTSALSTRSFSPAEDLEISVGGSTVTYLQYKIFNSTPSSVSVDGTPGSNTVSTMSSFYFTLA